MVCHCHYRHTFCLFKEVHPRYECIECIQRYYDLLRAEVNLPMQTSNIAIKFSFHRSNKILHTTFGEYEPKQDIGGWSSIAWIYGFVEHAFNLQRYWVFLQW